MTSNAVTNDCRTSIRTIQQRLKYHGGKSYLADWIISHMPPHTHFVEPFAGGLSVLLRKPCDGVSEVVNDLDGQLMNFWRVLQGPSTFDQFVRRIQATPFAREEFDQAGEAAADNVEAACRFFVRCRQSRQGLRKDFATLSRTQTRRRMNEQASSWLTAVDGLQWVHARLSRVVLLHDDACRVIRQQDGLETLFYLDPPYVHGARVTTGDYAHEMSEEAHAELLETLAGIQGRFLLSGYHSELYASYAGRLGWRTVERQIDCKASGKARKDQRTEVLWMNY